MHTHLKALVVVAVLATATFCAAPRGALAGNPVSVTPNASEMSPAEWRRRQLAAADKSDIIMQQAEKIPGLLGRYVHMQTAYDADHERARDLRKMTHDQRRCVGITAALTRLR